MGAHAEREKERSSVEQIPDEKLSQCAGRRDRPPREITFAHSEEEFTTQTL